MTIPEDVREAIAHRLNRVAYHLEDGLGPNGLLGPYSAEQADIVRGLLDDLHAVSAWLDAQPKAPERWEPIDEDIRAGVGGISVQEMIREYALTGSFRLLLPEGTRLCRRVEVTP